MKIEWSRGLLRTAAWPLILSLLACATPLVEAPQSDQQVQRAIEAALGTQAAAWNRWDLDAFLSTYEEGLLFASSGRLLEGRDLLEARYRENYGEEGRGVLRFSDLRVTRLGPDSALALGRYHLDHEGEESSGQFSLVFRKNEAGWQIYHDHTSAEEEAEPESGSP